MRAVVQRVRGATLSVGGELVSETGAGLVVYLGVGRGDAEKECELTARKICNMRIFEDGEGKMNLSVKDTRGEILLVSQFTLYGDARKGNRPSFTGAELPETAEKLYVRVRDLIASEGVSVKTGVFGADMKINQINDGPVTILLDFSAQNA